MGCANLADHTVARDDIANGVIGDRIRCCPRCGWCAYDTGHILIAHHGTWRDRQQSPPHLYLEICALEKEMEVPFLIGLHWGENTFDGKLCLGWLFNENRLRPFPFQLGDAVFSALR